MRFSVASRAALGQTSPPPPRPGGALRAPGHVPLYDAVAQAKALDAPPDGLEVEQMDFQVMAPQYEPDDKKWAVLSTALQVMPRVPLRPSARAWERGHSEAQSCGTWSVSGLQMGPSLDAAWGFGRLEQLDLTHTETP